MNNYLTLLILAGGMGSRFGGLKQIEPMGPNGEFLIDYSIYDAVNAGFNKVVFLIKEENYEIFKETIGNRIKDFTSEMNVTVEYCFQKNDNIPDGYELPSDRVKPLGTAHAVLCCKNAINEPFMMINSDDFYGRDAFIQGANFLKNTYDNNYGLVAYQVKNTITEVGAVKRGICEVNNNQLTKIIESSVERINGEIIASPLNGDAPFKVSDDTLVSMNMLLFTPTIFDYIESKFPKFFEDNKDNLEKCEYLIPDVLLETIEENFAHTSVISTNAKWLGVTFKEDTNAVKTSLQSLVDADEYPNDLWNSKIKSK